MAPFPSWPPPSALPQATPTSVGFVGYEASHDAAMKTGTEADTATGMSTNTDAGTDAGTDADMSTGTDAGTDADMSAGTDADMRTSTDADMSTDTEIEYTPSAWVEALVDCPTTQALFTYAIPPHLTIQPGDILSVPFGAQQVGAIAIQVTATPPSQIDPAQIRAVVAIISQGFFPAHYWHLLHRVAEYYHTPLLQVIRAALPPGLLARSQRRIRLQSAPQAGPATALSPPAQTLLTLLQKSKQGHYSWQYLQRQTHEAQRGLQELIQQGWAESYLEPPTPVRPKQRQVVTCTAPAIAATDLSPRQQAVLTTLQKQGGELELALAQQICQASTALFRSLEQKGYLVIQRRERLRSPQAPHQAPDAPKALTPDQHNALTQINAQSGYTEVLLHGVTGSGKTEVYLQAIAPRLQAGQSALVLVPEIGLTPQLLDRFQARFGDQVCVYHSALSDGERYDAWRQMLQGTPQVVIGTRSAIFAPLPHLGLIVLDEEHDSSFKQDQPAPCYHARTVAQWRSRLADCPLILGSATPALETWHRLALAAPPPSAVPALHLSLPTRIRDRPLPPVQVVDMRQELANGNRSILSRSLQTALQTLQANQEQGILFIHRRGHSTFVSCRSCGYVVTCPHCDVSLTYHQPTPGAAPRLRCHYCNHSQTQPAACPLCDSAYFKYFGSGTQRLVAELAQRFPHLRTLRFDSDTTRTKGAHRALITRFTQGDADVLVGTQMLTKGLDLPQVTLVGIVAADGLLHFADYRANERTFQVLTQVAGRCGRGDRPGQVILQTYSPEDPVIAAVQTHDYHSFVNRELPLRTALNYPPGGQLVLLKFASPQAVAVQSAAERVAAALVPLMPPGSEVLGPAPASILRVANRYRWQVLLKFSAVTPWPLPLETLRALCPRTVSFTIDVDPLRIG